MVLKNHINRKHIQIQSKTKIMKIMIAETNTVKKYYNTYDLKNEILNEYLNRAILHSILKTGREEGEVGFCR